MRRERTKLRLRRCAFAEVRVALGSRSDGELCHHVVLNRLDSAILLIDLAFVVGGCDLLV